MAPGLLGGYKNQKLLQKSGNLKIPYLSYFLYVFIILYKNMCLSVNYISRMSVNYIRRIYDHYLANYLDKRG